MIDEAVELAKEFSTEDSGRYVNGVLAAIAAEVGPTGGAVSDGATRTPRRASTTARSTPPSAGRSRPPGRRRRSRIPGGARSTSGAAASRRRCPLRRPRPTGSSSNAWARNRSSRPRLRGGDGDRPFRRGRLRHRRRRGQRLLLRRARCRSSSTPTSQPARRPGTRAPGRRRSSTGSARACHDAGAAWGGGESPTLRASSPRTGSTSRRPSSAACRRGSSRCSARALGVGDEIVLVGSSGPPPERCLARAHGRGGAAARPRDTARLGSPLR